MASASPFEPFAPGSVYRDGRALLAEIDALAAPRSGGLRPVLARWFAETKTTATPTEEFLAFLERDTGLDPASLFRRYVTDAAHGSRPCRGRCSVRRVTPSDFRRRRAGALESRLGLQ